MRLLLYAVVTFHFGLVLVLASCAVVAPLQAPWYVGLPILVFVAQQFFGNRCPITNLENRIRRSLGMPEIRGFIGYYILRRPR